ncbi:MAG: peptide chain release factor N(5)-glutamine methyltransferase [Bacteroidales bacterium]
MKSNIDKIRKELTPQFSKRDIESYIRIIFYNLLGYSPIDIIMHDDNELSDFISSKIDKIIAELKQNKPIQYIFGNTYFHGHQYRVTPDTLIPRPETEELVDRIIDENSNSDLSLLDIGTGSGAIAISLAMAMKFPIVTAMDISSKALDIAKQNATTLKARVNFQLADILTTPPPSKKYDIIVSNPPYICENEKQAMESNVLDYEPHLALFVPDNNPLLFYRTIAEFGQKALKDGGKLYFEINNKYATQTVNMLQKYGYSQTELIRDIHNEYRFTSAIKKND